MNSPVEKADLIDRIHETIALMLIFVAAGAWAKLAIEFMTGTGAMVVTYVLWSFRLLASCSALRLFWLFFKKHRASNPKGLERDSFTNEIVMKSAAIATLVGIMLLTMDNNLARIPSETPVQFVSQLIQAAMFFAYGISFLVLNRGSGEAE